MPVVSLYGSYNISDILEPNLRFSVIVLIKQSLIDKLFSLYRCLKYTDIFVIKKNTAWFHYLVINIASRLPFSCVGECWTFVFFINSSVVIN
jgi:hypothetical protein